MNVKKFVAVGASMLCAAVMADGSVQSSNIVGYQEITIPSGYSMVTVTFKDVNGGGLDLTSIRLLNSAGVEMDDTRDQTPAMRCRGDVFFQKINTSNGNMYADSFDYNTKSSINGWEKNAEGDPLAVGTVVFKSGEGIYINNTLGEDVKFRVAGQVELTPITMEIPAGYSIVGNLTPARVDLTTVKLLNSAGVEMDDTRDQVPAMRCRGDVFFQKVNPTTGNMYADSYDYNTKSSIGGWELNAEGSPLAAKSVYLEPGESVYLNNTLGESVYLQFPSPVTTK